MHQGTSEASIGRHLRYLEDKEGKWRISDVSSPRMLKMFRDSRSEMPSFGYTTSVYWFLFDIQNQQDQAQDVLIELDYPPMDSIEMYIHQPDGTMEKRTAGDSFPHGNKEIRFYSFLFTLVLAPQQKLRVYLRIQSQSSMRIPLKLYTPEKFQEHAHDIQMFYGVYFGLLICIFIYNLFIFLSIRDRSYLFYVLYILGALVYQSGMLGLAQEIVWPTWTWWSNVVIPFGLFFTELSTLLFTRDFLKLKENQPLWDKIGLTLCILPALGLLLTFFVPYMVATIFALGNALCFAAFALIVATLSWRKGFKAARLYFAAWVAWILGGSLVAANRLGLLPLTPLTDNADLVGFALNAVLFSFALADRINVMTQEKDLAQAKLRHAYDKLAEQDRLKSSFFNTVSHELRSPLSLILTPLERLQDRIDGTITEAVRSRFRSMASNTQRLLRLVNQLLDFSRLESGEMKASFELVDIRPLVTPIVQAFEPFAASKGIHLELRGPHDLPKAYVDPSMLDKVMCNLLSNACKFTGSGGSVMVWLSSDEQKLTISVEDSGIGISEHDQSRIFVRFHQLDSSATRQHEGSGIGLSLTKELVDILGASLEVESAPGVGSSFTVRLPLGTDHIRDPDLIRARASDAPVVSDQAMATVMAVEAVTNDPVTRGVPAERNTTRPLVVVVEDNPDMRALVADILQHHYQVLEAADGQEGLELIQQQRPILVILDVMMPRMDGYEMLRHMRSNPVIGTTPVILLTAKAGVEMKLEGLQEGADDYLSKPFDSRELLARARNLVRLKQREQELKEVNAKLQQEVLEQAEELERARMLATFLPPSVVSLLMKQDDAREREAILSQKRQSLTVFQMELRGFDLVLERSGPEEMTAILNSYLSAMTDVAFAHGATIDKFVRDTIVGFFGAPTGQGTKEDALRCVKMATEMWQCATEVCEQWQAFVEGEPPMPTMVLASGFSTVGAFGSNRRMEYTAIGGPMDEAATLSPAVEAGNIFCSQSTWGLIKEDIEGHLSGAANMPHLSRPIKFYKLAMPRKNMHSSG